MDVARRRSLIASARSPGETGSLQPRGGFVAPRGQRLFSMPLLLDNGRQQALAPRQHPAAPLAIGDEVDHDAAGNPQPDVKTVAFILLVLPGNGGASASSIAHVDTFRSAFEAYANGPATGGRGRFDTRRHPPIH